MPKRILVIGDSHTRALKDAITDMDSDFDVRWLNLGKGASAIHGDTTRDEARQAVQELQPHDLLVIGFVGAHHNAVGLLGSNPSFDVLTPDEPNVEIDVGAELIAYQVMRSVFAEKLAGQHPTLDLIELARCPVACLMTPPPKGDDAYLTRRLGKKLVGKEVNRAERRRRLWKVERDILADLLSKRNVIFVLPPSEAVTPEGFLAEPYWFDDAQHANEKYGALVLNQLRAISHR